MIRPKPLALHVVSVAIPAGGAMTRKSDPSGNELSRCEPVRDSANFKAAQRLLQARLDSGLTQEELAACSGESARQVIRRERGEVWLGALRSLVVIERAAALKARKSG